MKRKISALTGMMILALVLPSCGKKAPPVHLPETDQIVSVTVIEGESWKKYSDPAWISSFLSLVAAAEPTTVQSVSDTPNMEKYVRLDLSFSEGISVLFFYKKDGKYYVEQPYQGIYLADSSLTDMLGIIEESGE